MDEFNGVVYVDDPEEWAKLDKGVTRFDRIRDVETKHIARFLAEVGNPGFKAVTAREEPDGWHVELWKTR